MTPEVSGEDQYGGRASPDSTILHPNGWLLGDRPGQPLGLGNAQRQYLLSLLRDELPEPPHFSHEEWSGLLTMMERHRILPGIAKKVNALPVSCQPPGDIVFRMKKSYFLAVAQALYREKTVKEIMPALESAGVNALVLKGTALAYYTYPDPATRPGSDIDLLVSPDDVRRAGTVMENLGYQCHETNFDVSTTRHQEEMYFKSNDEVRNPPVEIHWNLFPFFLINRQADTQPIFKRAITIDINGLPVRTMHPADALVQGATHMIYGHYNEMRLSWIVDIAMLGRQFGTPQEWEQAQAISVDYMGRTALERSIRMAQAWIGLRLPAESGDFSRWPQPSKREMYFNSYFDTQSPVSGLKLALFGGGDLRDTLGDLTDFMLPESAVLRQQYPSLQNWPVPLVHIHRWIKLLANR